MLLAAAQNPQQPIPLNKGDWLTSGDYPDGVLRDYDQGRVGFTLDVDDKGRVTGCTIAISSGVSALDAHTCRLVRSRARFLPAQDAGGRPVASQFSSGVHWRIIGVALLPAASWSQVSQLTISGAGKVTACTTEVSGPVPASKPDICKMHAKLPLRYIFMLRGGRGKKPVNVINETNLSLNGGPIFPEHYRLPGRKATWLVSTRFTISEGGKVEGCRVLEARGTAYSPSICINETENSFLPDRDANGVARARQATTLVASSIEQTLPAR